MLASPSSVRRKPGKLPGCGSEKPLDELRSEIGVPTKPPQSTERLRHNSEQRTMPDDSAPKS